MGCSDWHTLLVTRDFLAVISVKKMVYNVKKKLRPDTLKFSMQVV